MLSCRRIFFAVIALLITYLNSFGQKDGLKKISDSLVAEGKQLYESEMASWNSTDLFFEKYSDKENVGGYFSYLENSIYKSVFFSKGLQPKVIGTITFDSLLQNKSAKVEFDEREFSKLEAEYYIIRERASIALKADTAVKIYNNTNLNIVPLIINDERKVYVMTGPKNSGVIIFGNDYLLTFDADNNLINLKPLHKSIIKTEYNAEKGMYAGFHSHVAGMSDFITPTDICTIMLYSNFAKMKKYGIMSPNYCSIWDCEKNELLLMTTAEAQVYFAQQNDKK